MKQILRLFIPVCFLFLFSNCSEKKIETVFNPHVVAFSSGSNMSVKSSIKVRLSESVTGLEKNTPLSSKLFKVSPAVDGEVYLIDDQTFEFRPKSHLQADKQYEVTFQVGEVVPVDNKQEKEFTFGFHTMKPVFYGEVEGLKITDKTKPTVYTLEGSVQTNDFVPSETAEKLMSVKGGKGISPTVRWEHSESENTHRFFIENIEAGTSESNLKVSFNGKAIDYKFEEENEFKVPSKDEFVLLNFYQVAGDDQHLVCNFSSLLNETQNLQGLVFVSASSSLNFRVEGNQLFVYPQSNIRGSYTLTIHKEVKSSDGKSLAERYVMQGSYDTPQPQIELLGKGNILPNSGGLTLPFRAVNLKGVTVRVIRIFESNVLQFLQVNQFDGTRELSRSGRLVALKRIELGAPTSPKLRNWGTYSVDLASVIDPEPGAIYRILLSFDKSQSIYPCAKKGDDEVADMPALTEEEEFKRASAQFDQSSDYGYYYYSDQTGYYDYDYDYDYSERNNPCHDYYYVYNSSRTTVARNILASDFGIVAKMGENSVVTVAVSSLITVDPVEGAEIEVYNLQQQVIGKGKTDGKGVADVQVSGAPFAVIVKSGKQRGYLKMDNSAALSVSSFDVGGEAVQKGVKGFIYGERGVWRPGDTLFISFILEDREKLLPIDHPVNFELINSRGQLVKRLVRNVDANGMCALSVPTGEDDPTGNWTMNAKVGGLTFSKTLKIETIKPNRLKIDLKFDSDVLVAGQQVNATLTSNWLHGAPARSLAADVMVKLSAAKTSFKGYEGYTFDDMSKSFDGEERSVFDGRLDEVGVASFKYRFPVSSNAPGMLNARFTTRVFEDGGEFSIDNMSVKFAPYQAFVGIKPPQGTGAGNMLETDRDQRYEVVLVDADGKPLSRNGVEVKIYKLEWSWWWASSDSEMANYAQSSYRQRVFNTTIDVKDGKGSFEFKADRNRWGLYFVNVIDPETRHSSGIISYIDWPSWGGRARQQGSDGATLLSFTSDKEKYNAGDKAQITMPSSEGSRALVSIENGTKVIQTFWVDCKAEETRFPLEVTSEMVPNAYVHITLVQKHNQSDNDLPIRLYGVIPIMVEDPATKLSPVIEMPDALKPESAFKIKVSEKNKQSMSYTVAIVDEGLLDLTRFKTPDPWTHFFSKEALGVRTWDMYDYVMGAYGGKIEQIFTIGGGDEGEGSSMNEKVNRFRPVVKFIGPFTLEKGKTNEHNITLPNYVGSVRTMVVAGNGHGYGASEKTTPVRKPLMALATLPRVLGPGEEVNLPATIFAMDESIKNVQVEVQTNDIFEIVGNAKQSLQYTAVGDKIALFKLKTKERTGKGTVKVIATSGNEKAEYDIEILIRNANKKITVVNTAAIEAGKTWDGAYRQFGMEGTNKVTIELSGLPPINFSERLEYLITYPHGCVEQTTSSVFPQLFLASVMELSADRKQQIETNVKAGIERLRNFQTLEGGFSYWPGERFPNLWGSSYAGHYIIEAEAKGYSLPPSMKDKWLNFQKKESRNWSTTNKRKQEYYTYDQSDFDQAYRLYTLALAKSPEMGAMNRLKEQKDLTVQARWMLAAAYALAGNTETANSLINNAPTQIDDYSSFSQSFGSSKRDMAMILETLTLLKQREKGFEIFKQLSDALNTNNWMSTQTTAYCLMGLSKFAAGEKGSRDIQAEYGTQKIKSNLPVYQDVLNVTTKEGTIKVKNNGSNMLFARIVTEGIPVAGEEKAAENGLKLTVKYSDPKGQPIDVTQLEQGTDFKATVTIANPGTQGAYTNLILSQIFPSGWEIINTRLNAEEGEATTSTSFTYQDIRDDRVYTYFDLRAGYSKTFTIQLNAAYAGRFYMPGVVCEAMYNATITANNTGSWVEVVKK